MDVLGGPVRLAASVLAAFACLAVLPSATSAQPGTVEPYLEGLEWPVAFAWAPDGRLFVNERFSGCVTAYGAAQTRSIVGCFPVATQGEQGLLGLALDPGWESGIRWVYAYVTQTDPGTGTVTNRVVRGLEGDGVFLETEVILDRIPAAAFHNGGILGFARDGTLFVTTGDATDPAKAQDVAALQGKVLRINRDGSVPPDNPIPTSRIFTLGHRNVFGLAFHPRTGSPYVTENGPSEDDEVNRLVGGANYGWPDATGNATDPGFTNPVAVFNPVVAPTGAVFATGPLVSAWEGDLIVGNWNRGDLVRVRLSPDGRTERGRETVASSPAGGVLDVDMGPDGALYFSTPSAIFRVTAPAVATGNGAPVGVVMAVAVLVWVPVLVWLAALRRRSRP